MPGIGSDRTLLGQKLDSKLNIYNLEKDKLYAYKPDKATLAYTFDNIEQGARFLTSLRRRCSGLSDLEISKKKNIRHIRRVINKDVLTSTEKGQFYLYQNPGHSTCLSLVLRMLLRRRGVNLSSTISLLRTPSLRSRGPQEGEEAV